jgi:hypothetical protein
VPVAGRQEDIPAHIAALGNVMRTIGNDHTSKSRHALRWWAEAAKDLGETW